MSTIPTPTPKAVTLDGQSFSLVAFYYPGHNAVCDTIYNAPFCANFWPCTVTVTVPQTTSTTKTASFICAEAAFQALKFWNDDALRTKFTTADGDQAFHLSRHGTNPDYTYAGLAKTYGDGRGGMDAVLTSKFADPTFKAALLATGDAYLLEHNDRTGRDARWSDNHDGNGTNWLGQSLMTVRETLGGTGNPAPASIEYVGTTNQFTAHV